MNQTKDPAAHTNEERVRHTPAPWSVGDTGERGDGIWIQPADNRANVICDMIGRLYDGEAECTQLTDEDVANAHLIAAAPDLLEAATLALKLRALENTILTNDTADKAERQAWREEARTIETKLRAAISKATKEQS